MNVPKLSLLWGAVGFFFIGMGFQRLQTPDQVKAEEPRQCVVIDMRKKPGPGKIVPAEPGI